MVRLWSTPLAILALTTVFNARAVAQSAAPDSTPAQTQDKDKNKNKAPAEVQAPDKAKTADPAAAAQGDKAGTQADQAEPKTLYNLMSLEYQSWHLNGPFSVFHEHGVVPSGFGIDRLLLIRPMYGTQPYVNFDLRGTPGLDFAGQFLATVDTESVFTGFARQYGYYDPTYLPVDQSRDQEHGFSLEHQFAPNFGAFASYDFTNSQHQFEAPLPQDSFQARTLAVGTQKRIGGSEVSATYSENRYSDLTNLQPITLTDRADLRYSGDWGPRFTATGSYSYSRIQQQGRGSSYVQAYGASGIYDVTPLADLGAHYAASVNDLNSVADGYVRKRIESGVNFNQHWDGWSLRGGLTNRQEERVSDDHTYVDVPKWNIYDGSLTGRVGKDTRLIAKTEIQDLTNGLTYQTDDPRLLLWSDKVASQIKIEGGNEVTNCYVSYNYQYRHNNDRDLTVDWNQFAVGASSTFSPQLLGYVEATSDQYLVGGPSTPVDSLANYFPSDESLAVGFDLSRGIHESLSASFNYFVTRDECGSQLALTYRRELSLNRTFQVTFSPWLQSDRLYDIDGYNASILTVKVTARF